MWSRSGAQGVGRISVQSLRSVSTVSIKQQRHFQSEEKSLFGVLNILCGFRYHTASSFAHFIECTATQNLSIGLMPVAMFFPAYLSVFSHDFSVLRFCCFLCVASLHAYFCLLYNPFSLFLLLSFYCATMFRCQSALILIFMLLFITV